MVIALYIIGFLIPVMFILMLGVLFAGVKNSQTIVSSSGQFVNEDTPSASPEVADQASILRTANERASHLVDEQLAVRQKQELMQARLIQAGFYSKKAANLFFLLRITLMFSMIAFCVVLGMSGTLPLVVSISIGVIGGLSCTVLPSFWLDYKKRSRQTKIRRALPDAMDLMSVCMAGGLSLTGALSRISRELGAAHPMLAFELALVERETLMGCTTGKAMRELADRFDLEELRSLASVIVQTERFGGSLTQALDVYSETMRVKRYQQAEERGQKAAIKILFPTLLCIFPGIFIVILGPAVIQMIRVFSNLRF